MSLKQDHKKKTTNTLSYNILGSQRHLSYDKFSYDNHTKFPFIAGMLRRLCHVWKAVSQIEHVSP
jgi:hypothetical protein